MIPCSPAPRLAKVDLTHEKLHRVSMLQPFRVRIELQCAGKRAIKDESD